MELVFIRLISFIRGDRCTIWMGGDPIKCAVPTGLDLNTRFHIVQPRAAVILRRIQPWQQVEAHLNPLLPTHFNKLKQMSKFYTQIG
jgi:hypothetical protein